MPRAFYSTVIDAPIEKVWQILRIFDENWDPSAPVKFALTEGKCPDQVHGAVRTITLPDGGKVIERLLCIDEENHRVSYTILTSVFPVNNYVAEYQAFRVTEGNKTFIQWSSTYEHASADVADMKPTFAAIYKGNLAACAARVCGDAKAE